MREFNITTTTIIDILSPSKMGEVKRQNLKVGSSKIIPQTWVSVVIMVKYCIYTRAF